MTAKEINMNNKQSGTEVFQCHQTVDKVLKVLDFQDFRHFF